VTGVHEKGKEARLNQRIIEVSCGCSVCGFMSGKEKIKDSGVEVPCHYFGCLRGGKIGRLGGAQCMWWGPSIRSTHLTFAGRENDRRSSKSKKPRPRLSGLKIPRQLERRYRGDHRTPDWAKRGRSHRGEIPHRTTTKNTSRLGTAEPSGSGNYLCISSAIALCNKKSVVP